MKRIAFVGALVLGLGGSVYGFQAAKDAADDPFAEGTPGKYVVSEVLQIMGFKLNEFDPMRIGGDHEFTVTEETLKKVSEKLKGKTIHVEQSGKITIKPTKTKK